MIERKNIINLLDERSNIYHSALLTTYSFDPIFFESFYLPTLRRVGISNIVVLMDANMYDRLLADSSYQFHRVTQNNYTLVRQENRHSGVFHPKMALLFGENEGVLVVGSGNLTYSGLSNNEEVWNVFHVLGNESIHYPLFYKAWKYLSNVSGGSSPLVKKQIDWMLEQATWLHKESDVNTVVLSSGEECHILYNSSDSTIINALYASVGENKIDEITVIAPFYDTEGNALKELQKHFSPKSLKCVLDLERQSAPYALLQGDSTIAFHKSTTSNPLHAKIIELQGKEESWILCGSANAGNMALGTSPAVFNDEACILLHSKKKRRYIKDLGISFASMTSKETKSIVRPKQATSEPTPIKVKLISCEEKENRLYLRFNKIGVNGELSFLDVAQNVLFSMTITTEDHFCVDLGDIDVNAVHIAVLKSGDVEISNRILIIREVYVESGNPDPKRRKLSSLLDDPDLLENLSHILGYIEFDEKGVQPNSSKSAGASAEKREKDDKVVTRDRFNELKDSTLSISMHSGVRILAYLQQILFRQDDSDQTDDDLLTIDGEGSKGDADKDREKTTKDSNESDASKMRAGVVSFLRRMLEFLQKKTKDKSVFGEIKPGISKPCLIAVPGLNAASSLAVASSTIVFMMNKYGTSVRKSSEVRDLFMKCAGYFLSLYANKVPAGDTLRNQKIRELLNSATVDILLALSFFGFGKKDGIMPQLVLNTFELWKGQSEIMNILPSYTSQLQKLNAKYLNDTSISRIQAIAELYLSQKTPIEEYSLGHERLYQLKTGHGFLLVDNIRFSQKKWSYVCHSPWFDDKIDSSTATKFAGYFEL